jgi:hypothetical protein
MTSLSPTKVLDLLSKYDFSVGAVYSHKGKAKVLELLSETRIFFVEVPSRYVLPIKGIEVREEDPKYEVKEGFGTRTAARLCFINKGYRRCDAQEEPEVEDMKKKVDDLEKESEEAEFTANGYEELKQNPTEIIIPENETEIVFLDHDGNPLPEEINDITMPPVEEITEVKEKPKTKPLKEYPVITLSEVLKHPEDVKEKVEEMSKKREEDVEQTLDKAISLLKGEADKRKEINEQISRLRALGQTTVSEKVKKETYKLLLEYREKVEKSLEVCLKMLG